MLRLYYVITTTLPIILYFYWKTSYIERHDASYTEEQRYHFARFVVHVVKCFGFIRTKVYGTENLPAEGGYVMYSNHQGKYDALGIIFGHFSPCTVLMDDKRADLPIAKQFIRLLKGSRLDKTQPRNQVRTIRKIINEVKSGRRYLIFPEGGYDNNWNQVRSFLPGSFQCAVRAKSPIVPVAIIDSYKPFGVNSLRPVVTQVHFLPPLYYEQYKEMSTSEIAALIRQQIIQTVNRNITSKAPHAPLV
ncbi:MAG: 1-acyl-sn-glycerol-3-phosphate acyltransferase [Lachnospiraceae bacterium]|nr:1-acyl-sn-glycerol-3-phosphate acyltransferase [Lachnospiraceae bacterium]